MSMPKRLSNTGKHGLPLIVVDLEREEIVKWTS
jgi:hypothetical protein